MGRTSIIVGLVLALLLASGTRDAHACDAGGGGLSSTGAAQLAGMTIGLSIAAGAHVLNGVYLGYDLSHRGHLRRKDGVGEVTAMGPAIAVGIATVVAGAVIQVSQSGVIGQHGLDPTGGGLLISGGVQTLWSIGLLAHGIHVMRTAPNTEEERDARATRPSFSFMPTMVSDGKMSGLGLGAVGRF
jgi:hypothetical protein